MKLHIPLAVLAATLPAAGACATTWNASTSLGRFDAAIASGLPQSISSLAATDETGRPASGHLAIESKLDTVVALPDGSHILTYLGAWNGMPATVSRGDGQLLVETDDALVVHDAFGGDIVFADGSHGQMYNATWHGEPAVATRVGDHFDVTSSTSTGVEVTSVIAGTGQAPAAASRSRRSSADTLHPNRLTFHLMLHDDLTDMNSQQVHAGYVAWWLADLQRSVMHGKKVDVLYSQQIPGVTDIRYSYLGSLHDWSDVIGAYAREQHIPRTYKHKFLLVTQGAPEPGRYGRSWQKGSDGIASVGGRYPELAHQLGHLLGAKHVNAEVRFGGWWCETNMFAPSLLVRSNCYGYSRGNMRLIDDYIRTGDGFAEANRWSEDR